MRVLKQRRFLEKTSRRGGRLALEILTVAGLSLDNTVRAQSFTEFPIPTANSFPQGIAYGQDGNLWFTEKTGKIGRITTAGHITEFTVPTAGGVPLGITGGPDGNVWFTELNGNKIGRITTEFGVYIRTDRARAETPATAGVITEFFIPTPFSSPSGIVAGADGALWFTELNGNKIGRITTTGDITEYPLPTADSSPLGIAAGIDGNLWFTELNGNKIGRITTAVGFETGNTAGVITEYPLPSANSSPLGIATGVEGSLWFTEKTGKIGRISTAGHITDEYTVPTAGADPLSIASGPDLAMWFTEPNGNKIGRITPSGSFAEFTIPTEGGYPYAVAAGPDGAVWFTEGNGNKIGRITTSNRGCVASPTRLCLNDGRFSVEAFWATSDGRFGLGQAVGLTPDSGYFWFFSPNNIEMVAKVLNGCSFNNHHWVFGAGLTNVYVTLIVTDFPTGRQKTYINPQGTAFAPIQDTNAFACS